MSQRQKHTLEHSRSVLVTEEREREREHGMTRGESEADSEVSLENDGTLSKMEMSRKKGR